MMELKQLAESITMVAYKKKLKNPKQAKFKNRPLVWAERIIETEQNRSAKGGVSQKDKKEQ